MLSHDLIVYIYIYRAQYKDDRMTDKNKNQKNKSILLNRKGSRNTD